VHHDGHVPADLFGALLQPRQVDHFALDVLAVFVPPTRLPDGLAQFLQAFPLLLVVDPVQVEQCGNVDPAGRVLAGFEAADRGGVTLQVGADLLEVHADTVTEFFELLAEPQRP
jgi:hypothetical protein